MKAAIAINRTPKPSPFAKAAFAVAQAKVHRREVEDFIGKDTRAMTVINKADIGIGTTTGSGWAAELTSTALGDYISNLAPYSAGARIISGALQAPMPGAYTQTYPTRVSGAATPQWVAENDAIPLTSTEFSLVTIGPKKKLASIIAWSLELGKRSDANAVFETLLREDMAAGLDAAMLSTDAATSAGVAGLLYNVTPVTSSTAPGGLAIEEDLALLAETVGTGGSGDVLFIMHPGRLARLRVAKPELARELNIAASAAVPTTRVVAVEPAGIITAVDPAPDFTFGPQATLHMSDTALPIVSGDPVTADPVRSVWQTGSNALRTIFEVAWAKRRSGAVAYADAIAWW